MGSNPIQSLKWILFPFLYIRPNVYSRLGYKSIGCIIACFNDNNNNIGIYDVTK